MTLKDALIAGRFAGGAGGGLSDAVKQAILQLAQKVAYTDPDAQECYNALYDAFYPPAGLQSISAVYTQGGIVYDNSDIDDLKNDLVVTATYADSTTAVIAAADYSLTGTLTAGTSTVTVLYGDKTTTFDVTVTANPYYAVIPISDWVEGTTPGAGYNSNFDGYYNSNGSRCCLFVTDHILETGYTYTFEHDGSTYRFGGNRWDANCLTAVANKASIDSYNHADSGWMLSGATYTPDMDRVFHIQWEVTKATLIANGVTTFTIKREPV